MLGFGNDNKPKVSKDQPAEHQAMVRRLHDMMRECHQFRERCDTGGMSIEDEWIYNAHRYMSNTDDVALRSTTQSAGDRLESAGRKRRQSDTRNKPLKSQLPLTHNSIIAGASTEAGQPIRPQLKPVETRDTDIWFLTPKAQRKIAAFIKSEKESLTADLEAVDDGVLDLDNIDLDEEIAVLEGIEQTVSEASTFAFLDDEMLDGKKPLTDVEQEQLVELLPTVGLDQEQALVPINDSVLTRAAQQVLNAYWDDADADIHLMVTALFAKIWGQQPCEFRWNTASKSIELCNIPIMDVCIDPQHYDIAKSHYVMVDRLIPASEAKTIYPDAVAAIDAAAREGQHQADSKGYNSSLFKHIDYGRQMVKVTVSWVRHEQVPANAQEIERLNLEEGATVPGIMQVVWLPQSGHVLAMERCPYRDIPMAWNLNILRPNGSPYGQGEPIRLRDVDTELNRTLTRIANLGLASQYPQRIWPESVMTTLQSKGYNLNNTPGVNIPMADDQWMMIAQHGGAERTQLPIVNIPPILYNHLQFLLEQHNNASGNTEVLQGRSPYAGASGDAIQSLAEGASAPMRFKGRFFEHAIERLARETVWSLCRFLTAGDWGEILSTYELPVIEEIMKRCLKARWSTKVELSVGRGAAKQAEKAEAREDYSAGLIGQKTTLTKLGYDDPDAEIAQMQPEASPEAPADLGITGLPPGTVLPYPQGGAA